MIIILSFRIYFEMTDYNRKKAFNPKLRGNLLPLINRVLVFLCSAFGLRPLAPPKNSYLRAGFAIAHTSPCRYYKEDGFRFWNGLGFCFTKCRCSLHFVAVHFAFCYFVSTLRFALNKIRSSEWQRNICKIKHILQNRKATCCPKKKAPSGACTLIRERVLKSF